MHCLGWTDVHTNWFIDIYCINWFNHSTDWQILRLNWCNVWTFVLFNFCSSSSSSSYCSHILSLVLNCASNFLKLDNWISSFWWWNVLFHFFIAEVDRCQKQQIVLYFLMWWLVYVSKISLANKRISNHAVNRDLRKCADKQTFPSFRRVVRPPAVPCKILPGMQHQLIVTH